MLTNIRQTRKTVDGPRFILEDAIHRAEYNPVLRAKIDGHHKFEVSTPDTSPGVRVRIKNNA
jgi:hypothetical protein